LNHGPLQKRSLLPPVGIESLAGTVSLATGIVSLATGAVSFEAAAAPDEIFVPTRYEL